jgi:hypothetical protein
MVIDHFRFGISRDIFILKTEKAALEDGPEFRGAVPLTNSLGLDFQNGRLIEAA